MHQRQVKCLAVKGDHRAVLFRQGNDCLQHFPLLGIIPDHVLPDHEAVLLKIADADFKGQGSGAAGEAGCFRIQKQKIGQIPLCPGESRFTGPDFLQGDPVHAGQDSGRNPVFLHK